MKIKSTIFALSAFAILGSGCTTFNPPDTAYSYTAGPPSVEIRNDKWEGFGVAPLPDGTEQRAFVKDTSGNPRVLWVIADTFGNFDDVDPKWAEEVPWFMDPARVRMIEAPGAPVKDPHWHGFGCYSRGWPLLSGLANVDYVLYRMIDVESGEVALLEFLKEEAVKYNGRVVVSNSWGVDRQNNSWDSVTASLWQPWAEELDQLSNDYPAFMTVFSSGNSGPNWSGFPQSLMTNAFLVGATDKSGRIASFSSRSSKMFCVAGGHRTYVADYTQGGKYMTVSGTSFSGPTVAAMMTKDLAENPSWGRTNVINHLMSMMTPSPDADGFNVVWGHGELEQYNQTVAEPIWRELGYPSGPLARVKSWLTPSPLIALPTPSPKLK